MAATPTHTPEIRYVRYDDAWLRDAIVTIREDLRGHMADDRAAIGSVEAELHQIGDKLDVLRLGLERRTWLWQTGATAFRWVLLIIVGSGGVSAMFGTQLLEWIKRL